MLVTTLNKDEEIKESSTFEKLNESLEQMELNQQKAREVLEKSVIIEEINRNKNEGLDLDEELVRTYEAFQNKFKSGLDEEKIDKLIQFGYPREFIQKVLDENEPNYCTAGYYLMLLDQNYC